jgi:hypothetical protein
MFTETWLAATTRRSSQCRRPTTTSMTRVAAILGFSCSQTRTTVHPEPARAEEAARSRERVRLSFALHHSSWLAGTVPCCGHECQKHPSTNTATRCFGKTMSALQRKVGTTFLSTRYLMPRLCRHRRKAISAPVSRCRTACILRRTAGVVAEGAFIRGICRFQRESCGIVR